jgi:hypothetical protein
MKWVGNGPELMADLAAEFALRREGALPSRKNTNKRFSTRLISMKTSYYLRQVTIIALILRPPIHSAVSLTSEIKQSSNLTSENMLGGSEL